MFTNTFKRHKGNLISLHVFKHTNNQTSKRTNKKRKIKTKKNNESQVIKYITISKTNQPKTL